jgi:hypothetical protein
MQPLTEVTKDSPSPPMLGRTRARRPVNRGGTMISRRLANAGAAASLALLALLNTAHADTLAADGSWAGFSVDANLEPYSTAWIDDNGAPLVFSFSIAAGFQGTLTVVDTGFSGEVFQVSDAGAVLGSTGAAVDGDPQGDITFDFDAAMANPDFSRASFTLGAGQHSVTGITTRFLSDSFGPLNATIGGVRLQVSAVPEPATLASLLAGLSLLTLVLRRRGSSK